MAGLPLTVIFLLLPCKTIDNQSIPRRNHRDLCKRALIGVLGYISGREWDCNLVVPDKYHGGLNFLHQRFGPGGLMKM